MTRKYTIRDPNYHKKHSDAAKKRSTPEYRKLQSIRSKKAQSDPVYKKMRSITAKERYSDPLIRKQMSERAKKVWSNQEYKSARVKERADPNYKGKLYRESNPNWKGGLSFEPYCPLWTKELRERIRAFFDYECLLCGKPQSENITKTGKLRELSCHHAEYNKQACCDGEPVCFAVLCMTCHNKTNHDRERWEAIIHKIIKEIYNSKSYYTKEEYKKLLDKV